MLKLSKKDIAIIHELEKNSRQSISKISKNVGLSKEVVNYNIKRLEKIGFIKGYSAIVDLARLGYSTFRILLSLNDVEGVLPKIKKLPFVGWVVYVEGKWDVVLLVWAKDIFEFRNHHSKILKICSSNLRDNLVSPAFSIYHLKHNVLYDNLDEKSIIFNSDQDSLDLDDLDRVILKNLSINARMPLIEIAKNCNTSSNVILYRLKQLKKNKIILGYSLKLDMSLLEYSHFKVILKLDDKEKEKKVITYLKSKKNTLYITEAFGLGDLEFEALFKTSKELHTFMKQMLSDLSGIIKDYDVILTYSEELTRYFPF